MLIGILIGSVIGFVLGWFVTRNNSSIFEPFAKEIDDKFLDIKVEITELKAKLDKK